jgi:hypothetical protein
MSQFLKMLARGTAISAALFMSSSLVATPEAQADGCSDKQEETDSNKKNYSTKVVDGRKVFVIEKAFVVCGKVPRPNVIYVLQATAINYEWETLKQDFLPKIRKSVTKAPF